MCQYQLEMRIGHHPSISNKHHVCPFKLNVCMSVEQTAKYKDLIEFKDETLCYRYLISEQFEVSNGYVGNFSPLPGHSRIDNDQTNKSRELQILNGKQAIWEKVIYCPSRPIFNHYIVSPDFNSKIYEHF